jgi:hypothetical protein
LNRRLVGSQNQEKNLVPAGNRAPVRIPSLYLLSYPEKVYTEKKSNSSVRKELYRGVRVGELQTVAIRSVIHSQRADVTWWTMCKGEGVTALTRRATKWIEGK